VAKRTLFYPRPLLGQGTDAVQSLRSYIEHLALDHNMKPRALLGTLLDVFTFDGLSMELHRLLARWGIHGFAEVGYQLQARLESATGVSLAGSTLSRFAGLFSAVNLTRSNEAVYCPCCVADSEPLPYGRLLWEVQCVAACPVHRVKLRSAKVCGGPASERLSVARRPSMSGVCSQCGSVGFKCIAEAPVQASDEEVWVAEQVQRLIALSSEAVARCSPASMRQGLVALVEEVYGGSVVRASREAGLSRSSVSVWVAGDFTPGLPWLLQLCSHARADVCALLDGSFKAMGAADEDHSAERRPMEVIHRRYERPELTDIQIRELLLDAAKEAEPPSTARFARRHCLNADVLRKRFVQESRALAAANSEYMERVYERRYADSVASYSAAAHALLRQGKGVHARSLQQQSGLVAFSQNQLRVRALRAVMEKFRRGADNAKVA
jgi:hypothetical protein